MITQLATKMGVSNMEMYRNFVRENGVFDIVSIEFKAIDRFSKIWSQQGDGYFIESIDGEEFKCFYGVSSYTQEELSKLLTAIVNECNEQGIITDTEGFR